MQSNRELRQSVLVIFDQTFAITTALNLLATVVAFIGILSALMALQIEQARQFGVMRANGMSRRQLWGFTLIQTASMGTTAGLAALRGRRHGGRTARVEALFEAVGTPTQAGQVLAERLRQDGALPGFGHTLYPEGDPRGRALLDLTAAAVRGSRVLAVARAIAAQAQELTGDGPTLDFGLVVLARALGLPHGAAQALFALGRTAGWIGQALEQYQSGQMIRPRARYVGLRPESQGAFA